jgi:acyl-CoA thioester hydrolase
MGRVELCRDLGVRYRDLEEKEGILLTVAAASVRYAAPARYDDQIALRTKVGRSTSRVLEFAYEIRNAESHQLLATGTTTHVFCGRDLRPCRLPRIYHDAFGVKARAQEV